MIQRYVYALNAGASALVGTACSFTTTVPGAGDASFQEETENITGDATAVVTIQVTTYTVTNPSGLVKVNGATVVLNDTFTVTLDGSGNGSFLARVQGDPTRSGTVARAIFQLTSTTIGHLAMPTTKQISKVY